MYLFEITKGSLVLEAPVSKEEITALKEREATEGTIQKKKEESYVGGD